MRRAIVIAIMGIIAVWSNAQQPPELPQKGSGPGKPLSPQEAQKLFKLDDGLRIELVACEPQIESPVAMAFDPDGRLWVVEMRDYPNGPGKGEKPMGRIRVLEDKDGDGFFETSTIWADNLLFANGLLLWKDGAIVTMAPKITHLRDTKGVGKADKEDIFYTGFAAQNPQLRVSHPILGLDGWIYCANGLRGGKAVWAGDPNAKQIDLSGMDFRFDPVHQDKYEAITGPGQFGNTFDAWGNRFICDNRHHLRHVVMENRYIKRNPYLAAPALVEDISVLEDGPLSSGGKVYPISKNWTTSSLHEGRFTAACGVFIYHGQLLDSANRQKPNTDGQGSSSPLPPPAWAGTWQPIVSAGGEGPGVRGVIGDSSVECPSGQRGRTFSSPLPPPAWAGTWQPTMSAGGEGPGVRGAFGDPSTACPPSPPAPLPPPILLPGTSTSNRAGGEGSLSANTLTANIQQPKQKPLYNGAAFTCEPTGNLVHMEILTPKGATFSAKPHKQGVEFLATTDDWCRPVFMTHGPEGALYVVDMYRAVIEHPEFMPPELKNRPDLWAGKDKGRIWRIVPKNHVTKTPRPGLSKASIAELVNTLEHEEPWYRTTAQRLLLEKNDKAMIEPLLKFFVNTKSPHGKILAAHLLDRHDQLFPIELMFKDARPRVRENAIRVVEARLGGKEAPFWSAHIASLIEKGDSHIRFRAALSLGESKVMPNGHFGPFSAAILAAAAHEGTDRWTRLAALSAPPDMCMEMLGEILVDRRLKIKGETLSLARGLAAICAARKDLKESGTLIDTIVTKVGAEGVDPAAKWALLSGLTDGLERRGATLITVASEVPVGKRRAYADCVLEIFAAAVEGSRDSSKDVDDRLTALRILTQAPWPTAKQALIPLVEKESSQELRIAALRALATQQDAEVPTLLMKLWPGAGPSVRREILEAMLRQPGRVNVLLDEIESKRMKASELDPLRTRQLANHKDAKIRERAAKLLANNLPADRQKVLKEYQAALTLKADAKNGREVFKKNCAICHRVAGVGVDVGPDIADTRTKKLDALLFDIIVPNAAIDANYVNYVVATKDGRILTGLLTAESASSVTLKRAENQTDVVLRKDIDEIASTGVSLMPDGLESKISVQEMADLLGFLKNWRYLDGTVPTGN